MKRIVKTLLGILTLALGLCIVIIIYLANWDPNNHKEWLARKFNEQTKHNIELNGDISLSIYPWLRLTLNDIHIKDLPEFSNSNIFSADYIEARIKLIPLLKGIYEIDTLKTRNTSINLVKNNQGVGNWEGFFSNSSSTEQSSDSNSKEIPVIKVGGIDIQNLNFLFTDPNNNQQYALNELTLSTEDLIFGEPIEVSLSTKASSETPHFDTELELFTTLEYELSGKAFKLSPFRLNSIIYSEDVPGGQTNFSAETELELDLSNNTLTIKNLKASLMDMQIEVSLEGINIQDEDPEFSGSLLVAGEGLSDIFRVIGQHELSTQLEEISDQSVDINTVFTYDYKAGNLQLPNFKARLLAASIDGNLEANNLRSKTPLLTGSLEAEGPDLPALLLVAGQLQGSSSSLSAIARSLNSLNNSSKPFRAHTRFDADLEQGNIQLPLLDIQSLGLNIEGHLNAVSMNTDSGSAQGAFTIEGRNLKPLLLALDQQVAGEILDTLTLDIELSGQGQSLHFNPVLMNLGLKGDQVPNGSAMIQINTDGQFNLEDDSLSLNSFTFSGLGVNANGKLNGSSLSDSPEFEGTIEIPPFDLRNFAKGVNLPLPDSADPNTFKNVALNTNIRLSGNSFALRELSLSLDQSMLTGNITNSENDTEFNIAINNINLDRYLTTSSATTPAISDAENDFDLENLQNFSINGHINIGELIYSNLKLSDISAEIEAENGLLRLSPISANLYEGSYAGTIIIDSSQPTPRAEMLTDFNNVNLEPLMLDYLGDNFISGYGNIKLSLSGSGVTTGAIRQSLSGTGAVNLRDGILTGADVGGIFTQVETMIRNRQLSQIDRGQQTPFDSFSSTLNIENGIASTNDLLILAPGFNVIGSGMLADLENETINFNLLASVDESTATNETEEYDVGGYSIPVACTGLINSPRCLPDIQQIIASTITNEIQQQVGGFLQRALGVETAEQTTEQTTTDVDSENGASQDSSEDQELTPREQLLNRALEGLFR